MKIWNGKEWTETPDDLVKLTNARNKINTDLETKEDIELVNKNSNAILNDKLKSSKGDNILSRLGKAGSTMGDLATNVGKGLLNRVEGVVDLGRYGVANVADFLGADDYANDVRERAKQNTTDFLLGGVNNYFNKNSMLKENGIVENIAQGIGGIGADIGLGGVLPTPVKSIKIKKFSVPTTAVLSSAGSGMTEAYNNGASNGQALAYGAMSGLSEGFSEALFSGLGNTFSKQFGGGALDDVLVDKLTNKISNKTIQTIAKNGLKATGEGVEEIVSGLGNAFAKKLTYMSNEDISKLIEDENLLNSFVVGTLTSAVMQTPSTISSIKNNNQKSLPRVNNTQTLNNLTNNSTNLNENTLNNINIPTNQSNVTNGLNIENKSLVETENIDTNIFSKQVDAVINGTYPKNDMLTVSPNTPKVLQDIGLNDLPITLTQRHLKTIMNANGEYKGANYHNLGIDLVKQLPQAISNPLNILKSSTDSNSIVVITELADKQDRPVIASIKIDGKGQINNIEIDTNVLTSAYGKDNYDSFMKKNIANGNMLYDIDEDAKKRSGGKLQLRPTTSTKGDNTRIQYPRGVTPFSTSNIPQSNNNVKSNILPKYSMQKNQNNTQELDNISFPLNTKNNKNIQEAKKGDMLPKYSETNNMQENNKKIPLNPTKESSYDNVKRKTRTEVQQELQGGIHKDIQNNTAITKNNINETISNSDTLKIKSQDIAKQLNGKKSLDIPIDKKLRSWSETSTESNLLKDFVAIEDLDMDKITYTPISNKKTLENAKNKLSNMSYEEGLNYVNAKMNDSKVDLTDLAVIDQLLVQAKQKGDYKTAADLMMDKTILGTELGQMVQQFSMIGRTTPEGQLQMYQKIVKRAKATGDKSFENVEITPKMVETVLKTYKSDGTYTQEDLDANMEIFKQQIVEQMKSTTADKINGWRYLSMLGNPKTHIRNLVSNIAMMGTTKVKNAMARTLEGAFIHNKEKRTKTWKKASNDVKQFARESAIELKNVIQGESKYGTTTQLKMEKKVFKKGIATKGVEKAISLARGKDISFKNGILEGTSNFNSKMLSVEDWLFSKNAYIRSLQEYLTAKGITTQEQINSNKELVEQAKLHAIRQAEIATFRQYSKIANYISKIENTNGASKIAVGTMLPFKKTPINVAKTGVKYSPLGLIKTASYDTVQLVKGNINASQYIDNLSQGMTGTSLMLIGYALAKAGFITGDSGDDKEGKYDIQLGNQGYALKFGNNTYSLSWLSPVAMPLLIGANAYSELENKDGWDANIVIDTLAKTIDPVSEMSFVSGLTDALNSYKQGSMQMLSDMAQNTISNYTMQFIPTLLSQIASVGDSKVRSTSVNRDSSFKFGDKLAKQAMYKIPGLRNMLPVATDVWGNEKTQANNIVERAFNSFISPFTTKKITTTALDTELKRVYSETGDVSVIPGVPQGYLKYKDETYNMNSQEYTTFKKTYGTTANKYLASLTSNKNYKNASDDIKVKMIETIYDYSKALANEEFFSSRNINYSSDNLANINKLKKLNMNDEQVAEYVSLKSIGSSISNDKSLTSQERHKQIANKLVDSKLSDNQLAYLYGSYYSSDKQLDTILTLNIPIKEFIKYNSQEFESDYNDKGIVNNSKKKKVSNFINNLNLTKTQKTILYKLEYKSYKDNDTNILNYINNLSLSKYEKSCLAKRLGYTSYDDYLIKYILNQNISVDNKKKQLEDLGFKVKNNKIYK